MSNTPNVLEMEATIRKDPVKWARWKLKDQKGNPWQARWYQIDLINDVVQKRTNRLAVRMGRRVGKCLVGETLVEDADTGEMVRIDQIEEKGTTHVWSMDAKFDKVKGKIAHVWDNGIKDVFKVTTVSGKTITATENHPFYRNDGWTFVGELAPGDVVLVTGKGRQINAGKERMRLVNQGRLNENDRMHPNKSFVVDDMIHGRMSGRPDSDERHYEEISSIEYIGKRQTYDLTIKEYRNFEANGFMVHNTETMCIYMLWHAFHKKNQRLLVAAPYENQIRLIFKRLKELIATADELSQSLVKDTSNPYELAFSNGTAIIGFTVGATSGAGASVRGQRADFLFIDEIDYISRDGIDATIAISYENPREIGIWASSTPTGKRDFFYKICTNRTTGYKSYHYPSMVNPNFDANMEQEFRSTMTEQGYVHEVMAEFGEETMGVFGKKFVEAARDEFLYSYYPLNEYQRNIAIEDGYDLDKVVFMAEYTQKNLPPRAKRILGVDWDKFANATQIVATVFDEHLNKFRVEGRWEIPRSEFTFDNAVKKIIELNDIFDYDAIYVDAGSGEMQIEQLRLHGKENPETGLYKKVKRIQFKQAIEVTDPVTGGIDKKNAKHFMVNQTSMLLERGRIAVSAFDDMVWKQMMDYSVVKFSAAGDPIYTSEDEHALDAFMLTILGFSQKYPEITQTMFKHQQATSFGAVAMASGDIEGAIYGGTSDIYGGGTRSWRKSETGGWDKVPGAKRKGGGMKMARRGGGRSKGGGRTMF